LKTAKLIAYVKNEDQTVGELRFVESGDVWPGYAENMKLKRLGYWYGTHANHEFLSKDYETAKEIINNHYGAIVELI
jgi:hypothetical protein